MQTLLFRMFILAFLALAIGAAHSWNTGVLVRLKKQEPVDWSAVTPRLAPEQTDRKPPDAEPTREPVRGTASQPDPGSDAARPPEPSGTQTTPAPPPAQPPQPAAQGEGDDSHYVTVEQAYRLFNAYIGPRQVIFIDARARSEFEKGHIEGAMSLPAGEFGGAGIPAKARNYLPGNAVVIYCQGAECHDSHDVAKRLQAANLDISPILIFKDGYPAWTAAGHPTMTGPDILWQ